MGQILPFPIVPRRAALSHRDAVVLEHAGRRTAFACPEHLHAEVLAAGQARARAIRTANAAGASRWARLHFVIADAALGRRGLLVLTGLIGLGLDFAAIRLLLSLYPGAF